VRHLLAIIGLHILFGHVVVARMTMSGSGGIPIFLWVILRG
jgi:hypothetical protein